MANTAWLALVVMADNFGRAVGQPAGANLERVTAATLRRTVFKAPTLSRCTAAGQRRLRPPEHWAWAEAIRSANRHPRDFRALLNTITGPDDQDLGEAGRPAAVTHPQRKATAPPSRS